MTKKKANHAPVVQLNHEDNLRVKPGQTYQLSGSAMDPDQDAVSYRWWEYQEAGTYPGRVTIERADQATASFTVPADALAGQTIHLILEVTDTGSPTLTRYQRVVATVVKDSN